MVSKKGLEQRKRVALGFAAEDEAASYLRNLGFEIHNQRFKTKHGEIDLVATHGELIVFGEVKARDSITKGLEAVDARSQSRIAAAAQEWIAKNDPTPLMSRIYRFDVLVVLPGGHIHHLEDAFQLA